MWSFSKAELMLAPCTRTFYTRIKGQSAVWILICKWHSPLMPTDGAPEATAARAYSIWTNFPDGLQGMKQNRSLYIVDLSLEQFSFVNLTITQ